MKFWLSIAAITIILAIIFGVWGMMGSGGFKRMVTLTGVYAVCMPGGYDVVCFLDADSKQGGLSCVPLAIAGGVCRK